VLIAGATDLGLQGPSSTWQHWGLVHKNEAFPKFLRSGHFAGLGLHQEIRALTGRIRPEGLQGRFSAKRARRCTAATWIILQRPGKENRGGWLNWDRRGTKAHPEL